MDVPNGIKQLGGSDGGIVIMFRLSVIALTIASGALGTMVWRTVDRIEHGMENWRNVTEQIRRDMAVIQKTAADLETEVRVRGVREWERQERRDSMQDVNAVRIERRIELLK